MFSVTVGTDVMVSITDVCYGDWSRRMLLLLQPIRRWQSYLSDVHVTCDYGRFSASSVRWAVSVSGQAGTVSTGEDWSRRNAGTPTAISPPRSSTTKQLDY